jgi:hypothetical protein
MSSGRQFRRPPELSHEEIHALRACPVMNLNHAAQIYAPVEQIRRWMKTGKVKFRKISEKSLLFETKSLEAMVLGERAEGGRPSHP